jgi:hypothetical protein
MISYFKQVIITGDDGYDISSKLLLLVMLDMIFQVISITGDDGYDISSKLLLLVMMDMIFQVSYYYW